eukprot:3239002-Amphidinium_carterae.1
MVFGEKVRSQLVLWSSGSLGIRTPQLPLYCNQIPKKNSSKLSGGRGVPSNLGLGRQLEVESNAIKNKVAKGNKGEPVAAT